MYESIAGIITNKVSRWVQIRIKLCPIIIIYPILYVTGKV